MATKKPKRPGRPGRPRLNAAKREHRLIVRLNDTELRQAEARAAAKGLSLATYARLCLLGYQA